MAVNSPTEVVTIEDDCDISDVEMNGLLEPLHSSTITNRRASDISVSNDIEPERRHSLTSEIPQLKSTTSRSRRKSAHKPVSDVDINLDSYVYVVSGGDNKLVPDYQQPLILPEDNHAANASKDMRSREGQHQMGIIKGPLKSQTAARKRREKAKKLPWTKIEEDSNPHGELMKKVAFLRACVNYMMQRLDLEPFDFKDGVSMPILMSKYYEHKRAKQRISRVDVLQQKSDDRGGVFP